MPLTQRQKDILNYIKSELNRTGYPPTIREIRDAIGLNAISTVHGHLESLEKKGYIRRNPTKPRAIEVIDNQNNSASQDMKKSIVQASKDHSSFGIKKGDYVLLKKNVSLNAGTIVAIKNGSDIDFKPYTDLDKNILGVVEGVYKKL